MIRGEMEVRVQLGQRFSCYHVIISLFAFYLFYCYLLIIFFTFFLKFLFLYLKSSINSHFLTMIKFQIHMGYVFMIYFPFLIVIFYFL